MQFAFFASISPLLLFPKEKSAKESSRSEKKKQTGNSHLGSPSFN
jgi:hypothetical protein